VVARRPRGRVFSGSPNWSTWLILPIWTTRMRSEAWAASARPGSVLPAERANAAASTTTLVSLVRIGMGNPLVRGRTARSVDKVISEGGQ